MSTTYAFDTTTFTVQKPTDYSELEAHYRLIRYILPFDWKKSFSDWDDAFKALYIQLRSQLTVPYLVFQHDTINGNKKRVIYTLYPKTASDEDIQLLEFDFVPDTDNPLSYTEIKFHQLDLHLIIKLLQSAFANSYPYFAGMGNFYIHAKEESDGWDLVMEIVIRGALSNQDADGNDNDLQEFTVSGHSRYFRKEHEIRPHVAYYKRVYTKGMVVFQQLRPEEISEYIGPLYYWYHRSYNRPHIVYHRQTKAGIEVCRGYLIHQFMTRFSSWLENFGISNTRKVRNWEEHNTLLRDKDLSPANLETICLYDARNNTASVPIDVYRIELSEFFSDIQWVIIGDIDAAQNRPILILQDANASDYEENGPLEGQRDPYKTIKQNHPDLPTQFINVNAHKPKNFVDGKSYLSYSAITLTETNDDSDEDATSSETEWAMRFRVAILQLYLKTIIRNDLSVSTSLPVQGILGELTEYGYLRKRKYNNVAYTVLLWVEDDKLQFQPLRQPEEREALEELCSSFGYDWYEIEDILVERQFKQEKHGKKESNLSSYDLILMPGKVVLLDELDEKVLYKYDEIERRLGGRNKKRAIDSFYLLEHYNLIKPPSARVKLDDLQGLGLIGPNSRPPDGESESSSVKFYEELEQFDRWLKEKIEPQFSQISLEQLREQFKEKVVEIFGWGNKPPGHETRTLLEYYKKIWNLGPATGREVEISKGIYFDSEDNAYRVAGPHGFNVSQDRAFTIRRFENILDPDDQNPFDMTPFLESMSVEFVRYNRYTVYPYFFYLLDIYINDILRRE